SCAEQRDRGVRSERPVQQVEGGRQESEPRRARRQGNREIIRRDPAVAAALERLERRFDNRRAPDGGAGAGRGDEAEYGPNDVSAAEKHPADRIKDGRYVRNQRHHPLSREPGRAPLRNGPPGPLGMAEMKGGREQASSDEAESHAEGRDAEPRRRRQQSDR